MYYLGIDLGTSNIKAVLLDRYGRVIARGDARVLREELADGTVEQDISQIYSALCETIKQITAKYSSDKIRAVGVSSQGGAVVPLDENNRPLGRVISWLDTRGAEYNNRLTEKLGAEFFVSHTGYTEATMFPGQFLRLKSERPDFCAQIKSWGFVGDVVVGMLTGQRVHDHTSLSIAGLLNPYEKQADVQLLAELGIHAEQLPNLQNAFSVAGRITPQASTETGLKEGTPVSPAVHDQYAAAIAGGVTEVGEIMLATGTAWVILAVTDKILPPVTSRAFSCPHPVEGLYGQMIPLGTGGSEIQYQMQEIGLSSYTVDQVDNFLADAKSPVYAAVKRLAELTGKQFELLRDSGIIVKHVTLTGPAAVSKVTPKIIQDVTGLEVNCFTEPAASAYGAALIAERLENPEPLYFVWNYNDVDRRFWREHLEEFMPSKIIDAHIHVDYPDLRIVPMTEEKKRQYWVNELTEMITPAQAKRCCDIVYPGREVSCVAMGFPSLEYDLEKSEQRLAADIPELGWHRLAVIRPQTTGDQLNTLLDKPAVIGVKVYYDLIEYDPSSRDEYLEASIFDFLPHHLLEILYRRGKWVTLHVPREERLGHPDNIREIKMIREKYPNIKLVIAHLGRCYSLEHARKAFPALADDSGLYFDNSAVLNPAVHRYALETFGPGRILYGTDNPIFYMRGRRQWQGEKYFNRTSYPFFFNTNREPHEIEATYTLYMYEALKAIRQACEELKLIKVDVENIFYSNAKQLIGDTKE